MESASESVELTVNGRVTSMPGGATLAALVDSMGLDRRFLVVEWNGEPERFVEVCERELRAGDRIELVRPVAGGLASRSLQEL